MGFHQKKVSVEDFGIGQIAGVRIQTVKAFLTGKVQGLDIIVCVGDIHVKDKKGKRVFYSGREGDICHRGMACGGMRGAGCACNGEKL